MKKIEELLDEISGGIDWIVSFLLVIMISTCNSCDSNNKLKSIDTHLQKIEHSLEKLETKK